MAIFSRFVAFHISLTWKVSLFQKGPNDNLVVIGGGSTQKCTTASNITLMGHGATFRMHKADYQQLACWQQPDGICDCTGCPASAPCAGACTMSPVCNTSSPLYDAQQCYIRSENRHGINIWCGSDITVVGLRIESSGGDGIMTGVR